MTTTRSTSRFALLASLALALCLAAFAAQAQEPLRSFTANYEVKRGSMRVAVAELTLAPVEQGWRWSLTTSPRGIVAAFYSKEPYSETLFALHGKDIRLQRILLTDEPEAGEDADKYESADFDWQKGKMKVLRKGRRKLEELPGDPVYDYQSIHLLAADMQRRKLDKVTASFYRKGNLADTTLVDQGKTSVEINGKTIETRVYRQTIVGSSTRTTYHYDLRDPMLPLMIETQKEDDSPTVLRLQAVEWHS